MKLIKKHKQLIHKDFTASVLLIIIGLVCLGVSIYYFRNNKEPMTRGEKIDLNDYVREISIHDNELPNEANASLIINKCYGKFHNYHDVIIARSGSSIDDYYFFAIGLDDGSVMVLRSTSDDCDELEKLSEATLSSKTAHGLVFSGHLMNIKDGIVKDKYINNINTLIQKGVLSKDVKVRYSVIGTNDGCTRENEANLIIFFIGCISLIFNIFTFPIKDVDDSTSSQSGGKKYRINGKRLKRYFIKSIFCIILIFIIMIFRISGLYSGIEDIIRSLLISVFGGIFVAVIMDLLSDDPV